MKTNKTDIEQKNYRQFEKLLFSLKERSSPALVFITTDTLSKQKEVYDKLQNTLPYKFSDIDLSGKEVVSLVQEFRRDMPKEVFSSDKIEYVINVFGLEHAIVSEIEGELKLNKLIPEINFERELLFRDFPCIIIFWTDKPTIKQLQKQAGDFWDWVTYDFEFESEQQEFVNVSELIKDIDFFKKEKKEVDVEATKRSIEEFEEKLSKLKAADKKETEREIRDKITIHKWLGRKYHDISNLEMSTYHYKKALGLLSRVTHDISEEGELKFNIGFEYYSFKELEKAKIEFEAALPLLKYNAEYFGVTANSLAFIYLSEKKYEQAQSLYNLILNTSNISSNIYAHAYYMLGGVFLFQQKISEALDCFFKYLQYAEKNSLNIYGSAYSSIGKAYLIQGNLENALKYYVYSIKVFDSSEIENLHLRFFQILKIVKVKPKLLSSGLFQELLLFLENILNNPLFRKKSDINALMKIKSSIKKIYKLTNMS
jgi:tetratricopeptide (TPR) repeat protein